MVWWLVHLEVRVELLAGSMLALSTLLLLTLQTVLLVVCWLGTLYVGIGFLEVPLLPCSGQMAVIPALISGIVMGSLLLRLTAWERLQSELHWVLPLGPVPHWSVAVLRLWPV